MEWKEEFENYLLESPEENIRGRSFTVHGSDLFDSCPSTVSTLLLKPLETLESCEQILNKVFNRSGMKFRLSSMPPVFELIRNTVPKSSDAGLFLSFVGTVVKTGNTKVIEYLRELKCRKCGVSETFEAEFEMYQAFNPSRFCGACGAGPNPWKPKENLSKPRAEACKDYQEIKVQEQVKNLCLGTIPRSVWVALEDDLVDTCKPGDDVMIIGVVSRRWKALGKAPEERTDLELVIRANFCEVKNDNKPSYSTSEETIEGFRRYWRKYKDRPLIGRDLLLSSFCPQVYGLYIVKLSVAVILAGGVERVDNSGTRVRGEPHLLMVGDPGTGKSQILKYASKLSPRSVMTTGMGSTSAGLTVSAVKSGGSWNLEAGALVLADGGICCIDEFNGIREADRTCIHEAMEQQSLSIAKAGLVCKLQTRCSVLAAANPKGSYDSDQPLSVNIAIASPLLSRFDLVIILLDSRNEKWDEIVSNYLLKGEEPFKNSQNNSFWNVDALRSYFAYIKTLKPELTAEAGEVICKYYQIQRGQENPNMSRTTVRLLQSIIRLSQGHARLLHHTSVEIIDAVNAILLIEASGGIPTSSTLILNGSSNPLHSHFPEDPTDNYYNHAQSLLLGLGLIDLWKKEEERINNTKNSGEAIEEEVADFRTKVTKTGSAILTQVVSKLKSNFSFVQTTMRKKRSKKKTEPDGFSELDISSSSEDENNKSEGGEEDFSSINGIVENELNALEDDEDDFEVQKQRPFSKKIHYDLKNKLTNPRSANNEEQVIDLAPSKIHKNNQRTKNTDQNCESSKFDDSMLDLEFSSDDEAFHRIPSSKSLTKKRNRVASKTFTTPTDKKIKIDDCKKKLNAKNDASLEYPELIPISPNPKAKATLLDNKKDLITTSEVNEITPEDKLTLSSKTISKLKSFTAPGLSQEQTLFTASSRVLEPKKISSLKDILASCQDEDEDLDLEL